MSQHPFPHTARVALLAAAVTVLAACGASQEQRLEAAKRYLQQRDGGSAVIELKNLLQVNESHGEARFLLGRTLLQAGDPLTADAELRRALEGGYARDEVIPVLAQALVALQRHEQLLKELGPVELREPLAAAELNTQLAQAHFALGATDEAQRHIDTALAKAAKYRPALEQQARLHAAQGQHTQALAIAEGLIAERADDAEAWSLKGEMLMQAGGTARAAAVCKRTRKPCSCSPSSARPITGW